MRIALSRIEAKWVFTQQERLCVGKRIASENRTVISICHFDDFVDDILRPNQILQNEGKQLSLQERKHLRDDDHEGRMQFQTFGFTSIDLFS